MSLPGYVSGVAGFSVATFLLGVSIPYLARFSPSMVAFVPDFPIPDYALPAPFFSFLSRADQDSDTAPEPAPFVCDSAHPYKTTLVSLDPLLIYIQDLITPAEIASLLHAAEPAFAPSEVTKYGRALRTADRTSSSAGLPRDNPAVVCVLARARAFLGTMLRDGWDEMGPVQLVRYRAGQRFNTHFDWYDVPRWANDNSPRTWNRVASFFAILQDNCTGGETHFPHVKGIAAPSSFGEKMWDGRGAMDDGIGEEDSAAAEGKAEGDEEAAVPQLQPQSKLLLPFWREHEDGGLAFRPVAGNAVFWVNLFPNGTGDERTLHAGLPLGEGLKTAMNIWPRQYYPHD